MLFGWEEQMISQWFLQMAYQPLSVYFMVVLLMFASSFGLPLPEEVTIIASSLTAYIAIHPEKYPPPIENASGVDPHLLAFVCLLSVFSSDCLIYWIGSRFGFYLKSHPVFGRTFKKKSFKRVENWVHKYGTFAPCIFRFTPGLRFPGHLMCGLIHFPYWKFALIVGISALLTVPTQVLLISYYGEVILGFLSKLKVVLIILAILSASIYFIYFFKKRKRS